MGKILYLTIFLASLDPKYQTASDQARRALIETPFLRHEIDDLQLSTESVIYRYTGLLKEDLIYAGYAYPIIAGRLSTKPFKNLKYESKGKWTIRPEIEYKFYSKEYTGFILLTKDF